MKLREFIEYANEEIVWYTLIDKTTGTEVGKGVFGKRYHWWILYALAATSFAIRHFGI